MSVLLRRLPLSAGYLIAAGCGRAAFAFSPGLRRTTLRNFRVVMPGASLDALRSTARASIQNYCRYLVDFARVDGRPDGACDRGEVFARIRCLARERGVIVAPMHFGNWDAGAADAVLDGFDLTVVGDRFGDPRLDREVFGARERLGMKLVAADRPGPAMIRALRRGGVLALLIDKPLPGSGVSVPFFGREVEVPAGPARLAIRTGAAVVPIAFRRLDPASADVAAMADFSLEAQATSDLEADIRCLTARIMAAHERFIRCYPDQWYMFREMWPRPGAEK